MNNNLKKNVSLSNQDGSALFITVMIMSSLLVAALSATNIIMASILTSGVQERSIKAYFAAEAGAERSLWDVRKNSFVLPASNQTGISSSTLSNGARYDVDYATSSSAVTFTSTGTFDTNTRRTVEINFATD